MNPHQAIAALNDLSHKLRNNRYTFNKEVVGKLSGEVMYFPSFDYKYSHEEVTHMQNQITNIIRECREEGYLSDDEYFKYMLDDTFYGIPVISLVKIEKPPT